MEVVIQVSLAQKKMAVDFFNDVKHLLTTEEFL